LADGLASHMLG